MASAHGAPWDTCGCHGNVSHTPPPGARVTCSIVSWVLLLWGRRDRDVGRGAGQGSAGEVGLGGAGVGGSSEEVGLGGAGQEVMVAYESAPRWASY